MNDFIYQRVQLMTSLDALPQKVREMLPKEELSEPWKEPNPILLISKPKRCIKCDKNGGHYFMGGLPALMQAVRLLQKEPTVQVTFVNDGQCQKSTQSAHQGHVHPTEWTTPELGVLQLTKILLQSAHILPKTAPDDLYNYSYIHFPLSKLRPGLILKNMAFKLVHLMLSKNGVSEDDRWQCEAVRASLQLHKELSATLDEPTFIANWRLIWSPDKEGIEKKRTLWNELGIETEDLSPDELRQETLLRDDTPIYGLKVLGDGKFFPHTDQKILNHLQKKHKPNFSTYRATVSEVYVDEATNQPFAVLEVLPDGSCQYVAVDSFLGSSGHNKVFKNEKPLWDEVPVAGVSTLWCATFDKAALSARYHLTGSALIQHLKNLAASANLTNLHVTVWDAIDDGEKVHILARATEGANFNSHHADPDDLANMTANINRFFIGSWTLITAGSCTRKTALANVPLLKDHFIHGLSGIGFSFSGAPLEMLNRPALTDNLFKKLLNRLRSSE